MDLAIKIIPFRNVFVFDWLHYFVYLLFIDYFLAFAPNQKNLYAGRKPSYLTQVATTMKNHMLEGWEWRVCARKIRKKLWRRTIKKPALSQKLKPVEIESLSAYQLYITKAMAYVPICIFLILCIVLIKNKPWSSSERLLKTNDPQFFEGIPLSLICSSMISKVLVIVSIMKNVTRCLGETNSTIYGLQSKPECFHYLRIFFIYL